MKKLICLLLALLTVIACVPAISITLWVHETRSRANP